MLITRKTKVYMITYDLNSKGQKYDEVINAIKKSSSNDTWCSDWKSSFLIRSSLTPTQIYENIEPFIDDNDRIIIIEVTNNYWGMGSSDIWDYIKDYIFR